MESLATLPNLRRLLHPEPLIQGVTLLGMSLISLMTVPHSVSGGTIALLVLAALTATLSLMSFHGHESNDNSVTRQQWRLLSFATAAIAIVLSLIANPGAGLALVLLLFGLNRISRRHPIVSRLALVAFVPWWIWIAADCWRWQLLVSVPLTLLTMFAIAQLQDAGSWPDDTERIMSARAHRYAGWVLIALAGVVLVLVGLAGDVSKPWLGLAGVSLAVAIPLEAGFGSVNSGSDKTSFGIAMSAFLIASVCWLIGIA